MPSITRQWNQRSAVSCTIAGALAALGGDHRLGGLLADLLEDRVEALRVERRDVGRAPGPPRGARRSPPRGVRGCRAQPSRKLPGSASTGSVATQRRAPPSPSSRLKKQRRRPVWQAMPADRFHAQQHRVGIAIEADLDARAARAPRSRPSSRARRASATSRSASPDSRRCARATRGSSTRASAPRRRRRPAPPRARGPSAFQATRVDPVLVHSRISIPRAARKRFASGMVISPKWNTEAASTASAPPMLDARRRGARGVPTPPLAITGTVTASQSPRA